MCEMKSSKFREKSFVLYKMAAIIPNIFGGIQHIPVSYIKAIKEECSITVEVQISIAGSNSDFMDYIYIFMSYWTTVKKRQLRSKINNC